VIEPSAGVDRLVLALICNAYAEDEVVDDKGKSETRTLLRFHPRVAPIKVAILPLLKNRPEIVAKAKAVQQMIQPFMSVFYDESGAIGRRYRRQDEVGTQFCVTIDFETLGEGDDAGLKETVTLRERDSMQQRRMAIADLLPYLIQQIN
jgi:glycyl-tRNA synthetase